VVLRRCVSAYDANRRFAPAFDDSVRDVVTCDSVLLSVGQVANLDFLGPDDGLERAGRGGLVCDPTSGTTSARDVFVAGDLAYGARLLIHAVASGKQVARTVYHALTGNAIEYQDVELHTPITGYDREAGYEIRPRSRIRTVPVQQRLRSQSTSVELVLTESEACYEASRCLDCGVNTIFDGEKCVACGGCVDVCPQACLYLVRAESIAVPEVKDEPEALAIIKDETICIRCGLCATRCPVGAISMQRFQFVRSPVVAEIDPDFAAGTAADG
jgi:ferredoxin